MGKNKNLIRYIVCILLIFLGVYSTYNYTVQSKYGINSIENRYETYSEKDYKENIHSENIKILGVISLYFLLSRFAELNLKTNVFIKNKKSLQAIEKLERSNMIYSNEHIEKRVEKIYYQLEKAWEKGDINLAEGYLSDTIYNIHKTKLEWMKLKNEKYIVKDPKFLGCKVIGLEYYRDEKKNIIWVYMKHRLGNHIIKGNSLKTHFKFDVKKDNELWKMNLENGDWVLDEIVKGKYKIFKCKEIKVRVEE